MFVQYPEIKTKNNSIVCSLPNGKFKRTKFTVDRVKLNELNGELKLSFNYDIISGNIPDENMKEFEKEIGDQLVEEIQYRIEGQKEIIFHGGEGEVDDDQD